MLGEPGDQAVVRLRPPFLEAYSAVSACSIRSSMVAAPSVMEAMPKLDVIVPTSVLRIIDPAVLATMLRMRSAMGSVMAKSCSACSSSSRSSGG